jgi:hypothetical protein
MSAASTEALAMASESAHKIRAERTTHMPEETTGSDRFLTAQDRMLLERTTCTKSAAFGLAPACLAMQWV